MVIVGIENFEAKSLQLKGAADKKLATLLKRFGLPPSLSTIGDEICCVESELSKLLA